MLNADPSPIPSLITPLHHSITPSPPISPNSLSYLYGPAHQDKHCYGQNDEVSHKNCIPESDMDSWIDSWEMEMAVDMSDIN